MILSAFRRCASSVRVYLTLPHHILTKLILLYHHLPSVIQAEGLESCRPSTHPFFSSCRTATSVSFRSIIAPSTVRNGRAASSLVCCSACWLRRLCLPMRRLCWASTSISNDVVKDCCHRCVSRPGSFKQGLNGQVEWVALDQTYASGPHSVSQACVGIAVSDRAGPI